MIPESSAFGRNLPLRYGRFTLVVAPEASLRLPRYAGSMFRGAFGLALKQVVCVTRTYECAPCLLKDRCLYPYVFDTPVPAGAQVMRKYPAAPHPFVLDPPEGGRTVAPGQPMAVGLTLIGKALRALPHFIFAFDRLARQGLGHDRVRCRLAQAEATLDGTAYPLYRPEEGLLGATEPFEQDARLPAAPTGSGASPSRIALELLTPLRIRFEERLATGLPFHVLVRTLLRRIAHLSYFHCGGDQAAMRFHDWIACAEAVKTVTSALTWYEWERYSGRQDTWMSLGGLLGQVTYEGALAPFLPLLRLGEVVHAGKATSFGLGRYRLIDVS